MKWWRFCAMIDSYRRLLEDAPRLLGVVVSSADDGRPYVVARAARPGDAAVAIPMSGRNDA
jgi:hypothetical protein